MQCGKIREVVTISNKLNKKQKKFADNYIKTQNAYQSAVDAGYSEKYALAQSYKMLDRVGIKEYINKRLAKHDEEALMSQREVLKTISDIARGVKEESVTIYDKEVIREYQDDKQVEKHINIPKEHKEKVHTREQIKALEMLIKKIGRAHV